MFTIIYCVRRTVFPVYPVCYWETVHEASLDAAPLRVLLLLRWCPWGALLGCWTVTHHYWIWTCPCHHFPCHQLCHHLRCVLHLWVMVHHREDHDRQDQWVCLRYSLSSTSCGDSKYGLYIYIYTAIEKIYDKDFKIVLWLDLLGTRSWSVALSTPKNVQLQSASFLWGIDCSGIPFPVLMFDTWCTSALYVSVHSQVLQNEQ